MTRKNRFTILASVIIATLATVIQAKPAHADVCDYPVQTCTESCDNFYYMWETCRMMAPDGCRINWYECSWSGATTENCSSAGYATLICSYML